jgi:hypothetical protein
VVVHYAWLSWEAAWGSRDVEWLDGLFKRGTDTSAHLILLEILLRCVLVYHVLDVINRDLGRPERWVILQLKSGLLLVFLQGVGHNVGSGGHVVVLTRAGRRFQLTDKQRLIISRIFISIMML